VGCTRSSCARRGRRVGARCQLAQMDIPTRSLRKGDPIFVAARHQLSRSIACRLKQIYALPPIPDPCAVRDIAGSHQSDDSLSTARAPCVAECRCRGVCAYLLSILVCPDHSEPIVLGHLCDFAYEIDRHPLRERDQVAC